jgi:hypothetical protein
MSVHRGDHCPICGRYIKQLAHGEFRQHGPQSNPCLGSRRTPEDTATLILPPLTDDQLAMMRECYRIGDWRPIELEFGIVFPQYLIRGSTPDGELAYLIHMVRVGITSLVDISKAHADRLVSWQLVPVVPAPPSSHNRHNGSKVGK